MIGPVFPVTQFNTFASQWIHYPEALLYMENLVFIRLMAQYWYHTEAMIEYMEKYPEEFHCQWDAVISFRTSQSTKKVFGALNKQLTLNKQQEWESNHTWNNLSAAAKRYCIKHDKAHIDSEIAPHLVNISDNNVVPMRTLNHSSDCI
jgi:hypothetical protein